MEKKYITNINQIESIDCMNSEERETSISISYIEDKMIIFTSENTMMTKLKHNIQENPNEWRCYEGPRNKQGNITGYFIEAPKKYLSLRIGGVKKEVSEEFKQQKRELFQQLAKEGKLGRNKK